MKKVILILLFIPVFSFAQTKEVIVLVELSKNKNKSKEELKSFVKKYSDFVNSTEPNTLGWSYHDAGDKLILIERYKNEDANIVTAKNISPGGNRYILLQESFEYYALEKVTVMGGFTQKLIDFNTITATKVGFNAKFEYYPIISGYSKNLN